MFSEISVIIIKQLFHYWLSIEWKRDKNGEYVHVSSALDVRICHFIMYFGLYKGLYIK